VRSFSSFGDRVLDPLGGVGTIAFEAALLGRPAFTCDLSPFAASIARAKIAPPASSNLIDNLRKFEKELGCVSLSAEDYAASEFGLNAQVKDYYHPKTLDEVLKARRLLNKPKLSRERNFIKACTLHILHGNRPYALSRTSHPITPFNPSGRFEYRSLINRLETRCERLMKLDWPQDFIPGTSWHSDFRKLPDLLTQPVNAVICSPPFPGMRFDRPNWLRLWFCGWTEKNFHQTSRQFLERQQGKTFEVYNEFFSVCHDVTTNGAPIILHVGGSKGYEMAEKLKALGSRFFKFRSTVYENVAHIEKHGIKDKGTTSAHILLVFERV
jgi:hypothetical protein